MNFGDEVVKKGPINGLFWKRGHVEFTSKR
jgi:hypothetical protein